MHIRTTHNGCVRRKYIDADFLPTASGVYDFISVDGRARVHCLKRALPLLKPEGGILMLVGRAQQKCSQHLYIVLLCMPWPNAP